MANIFADGEELLNKKDFDKKVNMTNDSICHIDNSTHTQGNEILGQNITGQFFESVTNYNKYPSNTVLADAVTFAGGDNNAAVMISVSHPNHQIKVMGFSDVNGLPTWSDYVAWQSDIEALKARISALEKQIGGVLSSLLSHLFSSRKVVF